MHVLTIGAVERACLFYGWC